jgi:hypothetical protein
MTLDEGDARVEGILKDCHLPADLLVARSGRVGAVRHRIALLPSLIHCSHVPRLL